MDKNKIKNVIVLSINPKYAHAILLGKKTVEFRRNGVPTEIKNIVIYSTRPDQKILGYCDVIECVVDTPSKLWEKFGNHGFINENDFFTYYEGHDAGKCYVINKVRSFKHPITLEKCRTFSTAPQSFVYLDKNEWRNIKRKKTNSITI